ncbi:MAG: AAA family ATPase [Pseudomonadota bacterium]|nr:AAA family ATPase [Pseudomonadota bacterium]
MTIRCITPAEAFHHCDPLEFTFETTAEVESLTRFIGQERALEAVDFGVGMRQSGFNLFVIGAEGSGRHSVIKSFINKKAAEEETPKDWCYLHNFKHPHRPLAVAFPFGHSLVFKREMHDLVDKLKSTIPTVFEGDDYRARSKVVRDKLQHKVEKLYHAVEERAKADNIAVIKGEQGVLFAPMDNDGRPIETKEFLRKPEPERKQIEKKIEKYQTELQQASHQISILKREAEELGRKQKKEMAQLAVSHLINTLKKKYREREDLLAYLDNVEEEITESVDDFLYRPESQSDNFLALVAASTPSFEQYEVNVLISHENGGAPVVYEDLPTYQNLHGRIEHKARMGVLSTSFTLIKPGSLHRANGGYLILDARRLLMQPFAYEGLKRTLRSEQIRIEPIEHLLGLMSTVTLEPEPIVLETKVVLIGDPLIYYLLKYYDPEFQALFKVQADFEQDMDRTSESQQLYGALIATIAKEKGLLPLHRSAVVRVIEQAAREAGDREKLSLHIRDLADLISEAGFLAKEKGRKFIEALEIDEALARARKRGGRIKERFFEALEQGLRQIETRGKKVGQVNGLSVIMLGRDSFGCPTRITALTRPGKGKIVDIEREVELGGPIHSKGVMILASFLGSRYVRNLPLGLQASLVFEQSYSGVEGDSASCAELCALLSSLAYAPIRQSLAITGSISQQGEVQAIGGVNEKIEGFFDLCRMRGLSGEEGVIIPVPNVRHLMLKKEVVEAIAAQKFFVYAVASVDEAIALLTDLPAGERDADGNYPEASLNGRVEATLVRFALDLQAFEKPAEDEDESAVTD